MNVTIKKIAADLKLAVSTVSKALRDSHEISPETKKRVYDYVSKVGYKPNPYASSLKARRSGNIAVVLPEVADSFFSTAIDGIEEVAQEKGYHVMVYLTHEDIARERSIVREFRHGRVDGVLMSVASGDTDARHLKELNGIIPVVFFDRICEMINTASVVTDDFDSSYRATSLLIKCGCRKITFMGLPGALTIVEQRYQGFRKAMADHHIDLNKNAMLLCGHVEAENLKLIRKLLSGKNRPDGLIGSVEKVATQAYAVCHDLKLPIPGDLKIVAFSSLQIASILDPPLTTVTQPAFEMGKAAATILFNALEKRKSSVKPEKIVLPSVLIERKSTSL